MNFAQRMEGCCQTLLISVVEQYFFYQNLHSSELDSGHCMERVFFDNLPKVSEEANADLSGVLTMG